MNSVELSYIIGSIDDDLLHEAENSSYVKIKKIAIFSKWREIAALAACFLVLAGVVVAVPKLTDKMNIFINPQGRTYSSLSEIPVKTIGQNYIQVGCNYNGPAELFELDGEMFFSYVTKIVGDDIKHANILYYTLFRFNTDNNTFTAISDEVGYIDLNNGRFIYTRSDIYLDGSNRWSKDYFTNNAKWDDEVKIAGEEARLLLAYQKPASTPDGNSSSYIVSNDVSTILIDFNGSHTDYEIRPDLTGLIDTDKKIEINSVIGITNEKVYFIVDFYKTIETYFNPESYKVESKSFHELLSINLNGTGLKMITSDLSTHDIGTGAFIGNDGFVYYHYRGDTSYILKVDPKTDDPQLIAKVDAYLWTWVTNGNYILCQIDGSGPDKPVGLKSVKITEEPNIGQSVNSSNEKNTTIPYEILKAAEDGIIKVRDRLAAKKNLENWGFNNVDEVKRLTLGEGFRTNYIDSDKLRQYQGKSLIELIDPDIFDNWQFNLDLDGIPKTFMQIGILDGSYQYVGMGGKAEEFNNAIDNFERLVYEKGAATKPLLFSIGFKFYLIAVINKEEFVLPIKLGNYDNETDYSRLIPASEIIEGLQEIQKNYVEGEVG